jgi:hypothetical protein
MEDVHEGINVVTVYANNTEGSEDSDAVTFNVTIPPTPYVDVAIDSPHNGEVFNSTIVPLSYTVVGNYEPFSCWYNIDGGTNHSTGCANLSNMEDVHEGINVVTVYANNTEGSEDSDAVTFNVTIPPTPYVLVTIQKPTHGEVFNSTTVPLNYSVRGNYGPFSCWYHIDDGTNHTINDCANLTSMEDVHEGINNVTVFANNTAGSNISIMVSFNVTIPPTPHVTVAISSPTSTTYGVNYVPLTYNVTSTYGIDSCWYRLDGATAVSLLNCTNTTLLALANGAHNVTVYANDTTGSVNSSAVSFSINVIPEPSPSGSGVSTSLNVVSKACPDNVTISLTAANPIAGRSLKIEGPNGFYLVLQTDSNGLVSFQPNATGTYYVVHYSGGNYRYSELTFNYTMCFVQPTCTGNSQCNYDESCTNGACTKVS